MEKEINDAGAKEQDLTQAGACQGTAGAGIDAQLAEKESLLKLQQTKWNRNPTRLTV
jgi:hypothetical protein